MKNRTVLGIICIAISLVLLLFLVPWLEQKTDKTVTVVRATADIPRGTQITEEMVKTVKLHADDVQKDALKTVADAVGRYAAADIYEDDTLTAKKLKTEANAASDVLYRLRDGEIAVTVSFSNAANGFSGQLENGDIVKLFVQGEDKSVYSPAELQYLRVITTLTQNGESRDTAKVGAASGSQEKASSVMFAVNEVQAALLFRNGGSGISCAFVCHGSDARAEEYLAKQAAYFAWQNAVDPDGTADAALPEAG